MKANEDYVMEQIRIYEMLSELFMKMSNSRKYITLSEEQINSIKFDDLKKDLKELNSDPYLLMNKLNYSFDKEEDFETGKYYSLNKKLEIQLNPESKDIMFFDKVTSYVGYNDTPIYTISYGLYEQSEDTGYAYYSTNSENYFSYDMAMENFEERMLSDNPKDVFGKYDDMNFGKPSYVKPLI